MRGRTKIFFCLLLTSIICLIGAYGVRAAIAPLMPSYRSLMTFELMPREIVIAEDKAAMFQNLGFDHVYTLFQEGQLVQALNDALLMSIRTPNLWIEPEYQLLLAECYFFLGNKDPQVQFRLAKPIYESLLIRYPKWENQPLVLFHLATIYERLGMSIEALAAYGLLIDWYPEDLFTDHARLGIVMASLRSGEPADSEALAREVLQKAQDAQILYHATLSLAVALHRQGRTAEARSYFDKTIKWPEDLELLEDFELFTVGEVLLAERQNEMAKDIFMAYLRRFPEGADRPMTVLNLAQEAELRNQFTDAVSGYNYLIKKFGASQAGVKAKVRMAELRFKAYPEQPDDPGERLLRQAWDQNDFPRTRNEAGIALSEYYLRSGKLINAIEQAGDVLKDPSAAEFAPQAKELIQRAFAAELATQRDNPALVTRIFDKYRRHIDTAEIPETVYTDLGEALYENLQADTLASIAGKNPAAKAFPRRAALMAAQAAWLSGDTERAVSHLERLMGLPLPNEAQRPDRLRFAGRLLWIDIARANHDLREALSQIVLAKSDAENPAEQGILELEAGLLLLEDHAPAPAVERLAGAVQLLGEPAAAGPLRDVQLQANLMLGEALYRVARYGEAVSALSRFIELKPDEERLNAARARLAQAVKAKGDKLPEPIENEPTAASMKWFWPRGAASIKEYMWWLEQNESRFGEKPDWTKVP